MIGHTDKWYNLKSVIVLNNKTLKFFCDIKIKTDHLILSEDKI